VSAPGPRWDASLDAELRRIGRLLGPLVPPAYREALLGDLAEEAAQVARRDGGDAARRWMRGQALRSAPPLVANLFTREVRMTRNRLLGLTIALPMGLLQAWDSRVLDAGPLVMVLVAAAIALPSLALVLTSHTGVYAAAEAGAIALLLVAKVVTPVPLPALGVVAVMTALGLFVAARAESATPPLRPQA
jgi:hypothetical protein